MLFIAKFLLRNTSHTLFFLRATNIQNQLNYNYCEEKNKFNLENFTNKKKTVLRELKLNLHYL